MRIAIAFSFLSGLMIWANSCNTPPDNTSALDADAAAVEQPRDTAMKSKAATPATDSVATRIGELLTTNLVKNDLNILTDNDRQFVYSVADLNGDGASEIFVGMKGSYFCGNAGCTVFLLNSKGEKINAFTIVNGPIAIHAGKTKGWNDLVIPSGGRSYLVKFNGKAYPGNPSVQPEYKDTVTSPVQTVLSNEATLHRF